MSFMPVAPSSALIASIAAAVSASVHLRGQEALDHRDFGASAVGEFLAAALLEHLDQFAALLHHLLQHLDDQRVVAVGGLAGRAPRCRGS